ncbi:MAG TPA: integrase arm-type DNA-binding domain-containing protein [Candidatus Acidoferrum sp.]|jgi:integrase|nr:integrase arm-type DNA-binding domain-containing protein [Candidatus Acidoferrum sp.]
MKLTLNRIEALQCPPGKRDVLVFDDEQRGLGVRVTASGGKTYLAQYTWHGQKRRIPLGPCSGLSLAKARDAVRAIMGDVARGIDPASERKRAAAEARQKAAEEAYTLEKLLADWQGLHLANKRPSYAAEAVRAIRNVFPKHLAKPAADLDRASVVRTLDGMARKGSASMSAATRRYGRAVYSWAVKRGTLAANPFAALPVAPVVKRDRVLSDEESKAIWRATEGLGPFNGIVRMLILTGQRREEVAGMAWSEISNDVSDWTIPASRAKNGAAHIVPLSEPAQDLLRSTPRLGELVFPGLRGRFNGFSKAKVALDTKSGVTGWRLHDLRRTVATGLQRLGVRLEVTEQVLNHISGSRAGIVGVYQRHNFAAEKRAALEAWGKYVLAIVEGRDAKDNVSIYQNRLEDAALASATEPRG